jgi:hypothetical protein
MKGRLKFNRPRKSVPAKIKAQIVRHGLSGTREDFKFAERAMEALPELRGE